MRHLLFGILLVFSSLTSRAQDYDTLVVPGRSTFGIKYATGFIIAHRPLVVHVQQKKVSTLEFSYFFTSRGIAEWERLFNYPLIGAAYQRFDLGNPDELGTAHAVYPLVLLPLLQHHHLRWLIRFGVGLAYVDKTFNLNDNYKNQVIGSHINGVFTTGFQFRVGSSKVNQLSLGIDFTHFSNGATKLPNLGLNIPTANIGYQRILGAPRSYFRTPFPPVKHKYEFTAYAATGFKEIYPPTGKKYFIAAVVPEVHKTIQRKSLLGVGMDYFYDPTIHLRMLDDTGESVSAGKADSRFGIHISYGLRAARLTGYFQTGFYLYNAFKEEGMVYSRLSLRYQPWKHLFFCGNLKTHFGKADFIEWGIGTSF